MKRSGIALAILIVVVIVFGGIIFFLFGGKSTPNHVYVLYDVSESRPDSLECLRSIVRNEYDKQSKFLLTVFITGDRESALEPRKIFEETISQATSLRKGPNFSKGKLDELLLRLVEEIKKVKPSRKSPIYSNLKRVVEEAQLYKDKNKGPSVVYCISDLEELVDVTIKKALDAPIGTKLPAKKFSMPPAIDNTDLKVICVGMAETRGETLDEKGAVKRLTSVRISTKADRQKEVWRALFTSPSLLRLEGFCEKHAD